jgi:hypothetical protein
MRSGSSSRIVIKPYEEQKKGKALQNRLSKVESQIKQLERT